MWPSLPTEAMSRLHVWLCIVGSETSFATYLSISCFRSLLCQTVCRYHIEFLQWLYIGFRILGFNAPAPQCLANGAQYVSFCLRFCAQFHLSLLCLTCSFSCIWVSVNSPLFTWLSKAGDLVALRGAPSPLPHIHSNSQSYPFYIPWLSALLFLSILSLVLPPALDTFSRHTLHHRDNFWNPKSEHIPLIWAVQKRQILRK